MVLPILGANTADDSYEISNSARFDQASSAYLTRTPSSAGNRKTWTWSGWVKNCFATGETALIRSWADDNNFNGLEILVLGIILLLYPIQHKELLLTELSFMLTELK